MRLVLSLLAVATLVVPLAAGEVCATYEGPFVAVAEIPCHSGPAVICTHGVLAGDLEGRYEFVMTSQEALPDLAQPMLLTFSGASEILLEDGRMLAEDSGRMTVNPAGPWPFETTVNVYDGEGAWAGARGQLVATGELDTQEGVTEGTYSGTICL